MNDYNKQLEETIRKQESLIATLRETNEGIVKKYNILVERFNQMVGLTNACGISSTEVDIDTGKETSWTLTMQVGDLPDPKKFKKDNNIDDTLVNPLQQDGDEVREKQ